MALATKCPHCHTVFRVALDQLKLRGGIVRCGACNEIFDGNAALVEPAVPFVVAPVTAAAPAAPKLDLELELDEPSTVVEEQPPALDTTLGSGMAGTPSPAAQAGRELLDTPATPLIAAADPSEVDPLAIDSPEVDPAAVDSAKVDDSPAQTAHAPADRRREPAFDTPSEHLVAVALDELHHFDDEPEPILPAPAEVADDGAGRTANEAAERAADDASAADLLAAGPESALLAAGAGTAASLRTETDGTEGQQDEPEFVRQAARRERSRHLARLAMLAGIPLLAFVLLGQGVVTLRNRLAADHPAMKPALQALCGPLGCTVELPRQIDALAIEQGELQTLAPNTFSFVTVLRNGSRSVQAWPHVELVLNDMADKPVLRRVFAPRDYLGKDAVLAQGFGPRSEQTIKLYFELDGLRAAGYHIAIFYP